MNKLAKVLILSLAAAAAAAISTAEIPGWAYPVVAPGDPPAPDDGRPKHVPNSEAALTRSQITAIGSLIPDWHPEEHPAMPAIVAQRREPQVIACGYCHLPSGAGRPENASLAGLTPAYIKQQVIAFRKGDRPGSAPARLPQSMMIAVAQAVTEAEIDEAATYFASIRPAGFVQVVETTTVPKTVVAGWILTKAPGAGMEPMGNRIIEMPEDFERFENRDSRTPYLAYVPVGRIQKGAELVATGVGGKTPLCITCHGPELRGLADVPRLAGRSPSYLMRQLFDLRSGTRKGGASELMKPVVANLTDDDMVAIVAYLASREP